MPRLAARTLLMLAGAYALQCTDKTLSSSVAVSLRIELHGGDQPSSVPTNLDVHVGQHPGHALREYAALHALSDADRGAAGDEVVRIVVRGLSGRTPLATLVVGLGGADRPSAAADRRCRADGWDDVDRAAAAFFAQHSYAAVALVLEGDGDADSGSDDLFGAYVRSAYMHTGNVSAPFVWTYGSSAPGGVLPSVVVADAATYGRSGGLAAAGGPLPWLRAACRRGACFHQWPAARPHRSPYEDDAAAVAVAPDGEARRTPRHVLLLVTQGASDTSTRGTFADVVEALRGGLEALGHAVSAVACDDLTRCAVPEPAGGGATVVVAPHNLLAYRSGDGGAAVLGGLLALPEGAVLYNFERVPPPAVDLAEAERELVALYRLWDGRVWDYSAANVARLAAHGVAAHRVPLAHAPALVSEHAGARGRPYGDDADLDRPQMDVLFAGTLTPRRRRALAALRAGGLRVAHANAANDGVFGARLDALLADAAVHLNLLAFDDAAEWKITRFARALANGAFIVSEDCGAGEPQRAALAQGIVWAEGGAALLQALRGALADPAGRAAVAREGRRAAEADAAEGRRILGERVLGVVP